MFFDPLHKIKNILITAVFITQILLEMVTNTIDSKVQLLLELNFIVLLKQF